MIHPVILLQLFNILIFAGSSAMREHVWSDGRLLGSFGCEKISPRYAPPTSNCVTFLRPGISMTLFSGFWGLLPVDQQSRYFQLFTASIKGSQWITLDFFGLYWIQLSLSLEPTPWFYIQRIPHSTLLFSSAHFTYSVTQCGWKIWPRNVEN